MRALCLLLPFAVLTGCSSVDKALVARTEKELKRYKASFQKRESAPEPGTPVPVPWTKGQYAVWAITTSRGTTLTEVQIEEADTEAVIVMMTIISPKVRTTARLTFKQQPHTRAEAREMLTQIIRRRGEERALTYRFHEDMRVDMREALEPLWGMLVPEPIAGAPREVAKTPAAIMEGAVPATGVFMYAPLGLEVRALLHPGVPINGLVTATATSGETVELMDMGWAGGAPAL